MVEVVAKIRLAGLDIAQNPPPQEVLVVDGGGVPQ